MSQKNAILLKTFDAWQRTGSRKDLAAYFEECNKQGRAVDKRTGKITPLSKEKEFSMKRIIERMGGKFKSGPKLPLGPESVQTTRNTKTGKRQTVWPGAPRGAQRSKRIAGKTRQCYERFR